MTISFEPLRRIIDGLVHDSVSQDALAVAGHRAFIAAHLSAGLAALVLLPLWLALAGPPSLIGAIAFVWLVLPLPIAAFLSRTGRYGDAHLLSAFALVGLVAWVGSLTGGMASPAIVWLAVVPAEAALSGSRRITITATLLAAIGLGGLIAATVTGLLPPALSGTERVAPFLIGAAIIYGGALALRIDRIHRETGAAARNGEARYRLLADNATDLITRHGKNGEVEFASPAARSITGVSPAEILHQGLFERIHVADRPAFLHALSEADRTGETVCVEYRLRRSEERRPEQFVWLEMRCRPAVDPATALRSIIAVSRDVTERKAQTDALAAAHAEVATAGRAKDLFLANMSHELRTPLNAIIGFSEMLQQQLAGHPDFVRQQEHARLINTAGEHLLEVVNSILDISKIEAGRFEIASETFGLGAIVESAVDMMSQQIAIRGLRLDCSVPRNLPDLVGDRRACRQILINLLSNATKFTDCGGSISVSARPDRDAVLLEIADTGVGIAAADLARLGAPFVQVDSNYDRRHEGTGLGLSIVKGLVALHGGTLRIDSEPGRGTTVSIRLPAVAQATSPAVTIMRGAFAPPVEERRIA